jgi:hydroxyacylglutathione hydrolase
VIFKRFYDEQLAQASYLIGCSASSEACVIDPNRNVEQYLEAAASDGLRIVAITETHIHADFLSGARELGQRTAARLYLSDEGDEDWKYAYADEPNVTLVRHGDAIRVGNLRLDIVRTPGHTPEHISLVLTDEAASPMPLGAFTGDFLFVGDVGRPDLLERAAGFEGTMEQGALALYESLQGFMSGFPDSLLIWPGHGAGSACGKTLGGSPMSSLGYEKASNWGLKANNALAFVEAVLDGQPEPPTYFKIMKRLNKVGPPLSSSSSTPTRLDGAGFLSRLDQASFVLDVRPASIVAQGYLPGSLNIPVGKSLTSWAGWLVPYDRPIFLIADSDANVYEALQGLGMIGLDDVRAWAGNDVLRAYEKMHGPLPMHAQVDVRELAESIRSGATTLLDVRGRSEFERGHAAGATNIPLGYLSSRAGMLERGKTVAVMCQGGTRSAMATSLLAQLGHSNVVNVPGGFADYLAASLPIEIGPEALAV